MAIVYAPAMGNILGDAWRKIKSDPLVLAPPLWLGKESIKLLPGIVQGARNEVRDTVGAFRPQPPPVDALSSALTFGSGGAAGGEPGGSSSLPIIVGAVAAAGLLLLAFGRKKK